MSSNNVSAKPVDGDAFDCWSLRFKKRFERFRLPILIAGHLVIFVAVYLCALYLRFEQFLPENPRHLKVLPIVLIVKLACFWSFQTFHGWWRHVTFTDLVLMAKATLSSVGIFFLLDYLILSEQISRAVILIDGAFTIAVMSALRGLWRSWDERLLFRTNDRNSKRALMVGDDIATAKLATLINNRQTIKTQVVGLVSPQDATPRRFSQLRVVGPADKIKNLCRDLRIDLLYVPAGMLPAKQIGMVIDQVREFNVKVNIVPALSSTLEGGTKIPIREVCFEDLLRRDPVDLDQDLIHGMLEGKRILVTGAGGSIGSELCRQIMKFEPAQLIVLGRGENRIYQIEKELVGLQTVTDISPVIACIKDQKRIEEIFRAFNPEVVFHAAAHKHVPLVEQNIGEAILNNVYGTKVVADACHEFGVSQFVMISTDKAVNPTSVMGCTKQMAERYCLSLAHESKTNFVVTRFGNVLGSAGSVVPLFKKQIQEGGPLTVTDPKMTRFFMTIPEASQLVIQAGAMGKGGEIFVLEMGEPVKIVDLANDLIRLAGLPPGSIDIKFTGIRQGEKLYEELYYHDEKSLPTQHEKILTAYNRPFDFEETCGEVNQLVDLAFADPNLIRAQLKELIPEFIQPLEITSPQPVQPAKS